METGSRPGGRAVDLLWEFPFVCGGEWPTESRLEAKLPLPFMLRWSGRKLGIAVWWTEG